ncbi:MAG: hypothetical protein BKP49_05375 [Treponema sp. CETP13]|nr:MAG: hypothetical protein BKP49_05375 [Treponema sp. CETP13]
MLHTTESYINTIFNFFRSVKLAIALILIIACVCIIGGIIPQNGVYIDYFDKYGKSGAEFITRHSLDHIFTSKWLVLPGVLFLFNLLLCTITRFTTQLKKTSHRRFGVDIMHTGLLILGIGAIVSMTTKTTELIQLEEGKSTQLANGLILQVHEATQELYSDNRPSFWSATFSLLQKNLESNSNEILADHVTTMVNHPYTKNGSKYYLQGYSETPQMVLQNISSSDTIWDLYQGDQINNQDTSIVFMLYNKENQTAHVLVKNNQTKNVLQVKAGDEISGYRIKEFKTVHSSVINIVKDRGFILVLLGAIFAGIGVLITYFQKFTDASKELD